MGFYGDNTKERDKLRDEVEKIESSVAASASSSAVKLPSVTLDKLEYNAPSDEYIAQSAESSLKNYRDGGIAKLKSDSQQQVQELEALRGTYDADMAKEKELLGIGYENAVRAVDNDAIKRGLARSSIAAVNRGELESEYLKKTADIAGAYGKSIVELDKQIAAADGKLRAALDDFNLTYASKLNEKISELKAERDKRVDEVIKYNNEVKAKQAALDESKAKAESMLSAQATAQQKNALDALPVQTRNAMYKAVYDKMDEMLSAMSPIEARRELINHTYYREHLSEYYYTKLYDKYARTGEDK